MSLWKAEPSGGAICVYTALTGGYERLNEQPAAKRSTWRFICLTDDPELRSETWECRLIRPAFTLDPIRSQRDLKIRPHLHLPEFDTSIYIDNSVILERPPEALWAARDIGAGLSLPRHSGRETLLDEFVAVSQLALDDPTRIFEQLNHYMLAHPDLLEEPCWWTAILLRQHHRPEVRHFGEIWAAHVLRYSRRDQLSVNLAIRKAGIIPYVLPLDNRRSSFHRWPVTSGRVRNAGPRDVSVNLMPLLARIQRLEQREAEVTRVRASLLWRATEPARWLARRLPLMRLAVPHPVARVAFTRARDLPLFGTQVMRAELKRRFVYANGRPARLDPPISFNDHMLARILKERDPRFREYCNTLTMRAMVGRVLKADYLIPLLGLWTDPKTIDWSALPECFVLKASHAPGAVMLVRSTAERDIAKLMAKVRDCLATDHFDASLQWGYRGIARRILAEPLLAGPAGRPLINVQVYTFGGFVAVLRAFSSENNKATQRERWYDREGRPVPMRSILPADDVEISPNDLGCIVASAEALAAGTIHIRVDILLSEEGPKVFRITPYALAGHAQFEPPVWNERLGRIWTVAKRGEPVADLIRHIVDGVSDPVPWTRESTTLRT